MEDKVILARVFTTHVSGTLSFSLKACVDTVLDSVWRARTIDCIVWGLYIAEKTSRYRKQHRNLYRDMRPEIN